MVKVSVTSINLFGVTVKLLKSISWSAVYAILPQMFGIFFVRLDKLLDKFEKLPHLSPEYKQCLIFKWLERNFLTDLTTRIWSHKHKKSTLKNQYEYILCFTQKLRKLINKKLLLN